MKKPFEDRISGVSLPPQTAGDVPGVSSVARGPEGWKLTRRSVMGLLAAGGFAGLPRAAGPSPCAAGAFAHQIQIHSLGFFPNGKTLISAGRDRLVKFWTVPEAALFRSLVAEDVPFQVAVSPDGSQIAVGMDNGHLELWSADGVTRRALAGHSGAVNGVAFTPDGGQLVSVSSDRSTKVWSVADATLVRSFADNDLMLHVAIPSGQRRIQAGQKQTPGPSQPAAQRRLMLTSNGQLYLRMLATGAIAKAVPGMAFAVSPNGQFVAAHDGVRLYMYGFPGMTTLVSVVEKRTAMSLAFSADGKRLSIAYADAPARLYSAPDLTLLREMEANDGPCDSTAMDPQNGYMAVASGKSIRLYKLPAGDRVSVCFMDIAASSPGCRGTQYGLGGIVYTVGCGTGFPGDAVCTCNCVPGNCPCVFDTGCGCDGDIPCPCDSDTGCGCDYQPTCSCDSDTGCMCVGDIGCNCDFDFGCGCVDDWGCGCDGDFGCGCDGDYWGCDCDGDFG
jgi:WD40 repeat protein